MRLLGFAAVPLLLSASICLAPSTGLAQLAVSANDGKAYLDNGVAKTVPNAPPDTVSIIDLSATPPKLVTEIQVPASVAGPPGSVAVAPDESYALVTAAMKVDPADATKQAPDDKLSVIDLKSSPPKVVQTVTVGKGAAGVSINKAGTLALVANRSEGTVSVLTISGGKVTEKEKIKLGEANSGPSQPVFTPDGAVALVTRDNDHKISVLSVSGDKVEYTKRDINAGLRPYQIDVASSGEVAVVANIGLGQGDADTVSVIDLKAKPPRVVNTVTVGQTPEGIKMSPDGRFVAVTVMNGSNKPKDSPFVSDHGLVRIYRLSGKDLTHLTDDKVGHWCQGAAWSRNGRTLLVQCMVEKEIYDFEFDGNGMKKRSAIKVNGGPAGIRTAEP
jgi:DNA-binding beta-propeller fold protein YncE